MRRLSTIAKAKFSLYPAHVVIIITGLKLEEIYDQDSRFHKACLAPERFLSSPPPLIHTHTTQSDNGWIRAISLLCRQTPPLATTGQDPDNGIRPPL